MKVQGMKIQVKMEKGMKVQGMKVQGMTGSAPPPCKRGDLAVRVPLSNGWIFEFLNLKGGPVPKGGPNF